MSAPAARAKARKHAQSGQKGEKSAAIQRWFRHVNIHASTHAAAGVMQTIPKSLAVAKIVISIFFMIIISGCQNFKDWMEKSDSEFAEKIYTSNSKDVCAMSKQNFGPRTKRAIQKTIEIRRLDCDELIQSDRASETAIQREKRINDAIQLLNSAAQMSSPTTNQSSTPGIGHVCHLAGQSRSGLYNNCAYNCISGTVYRTMSSTDICPISVRQ